jgi:hypothetical protein
MTPTSDIRLDRRQLGLAAGALSLAGQLPQQAARAPRGPAPSSPVGAPAAGYRNWRQSCRIPLRRAATSGHSLNVWDGPDGSWR